MHRDGDARRLVREPGGVAEHGGHGVRGAAVHPRVGPTEQQERLAVAAQTPGDVAQLGDPRAVVGQLCEQGDAVEEGLLAVDPVLQAPAEIGRGPVVAAGLRAVADDG